LSGAQPPASLLIGKEAKMNINEVAGNTGEKGVEKGLLNGGKEEKQL